MTIRKRSVKRPRVWCAGLAVRAVIESLETRALLDGCFEDATVTFYEEDAGISAPVEVSDAAQSAPSSSWLAPTGVRTWYGYNGISFRNSDGTISGDGHGQTIAIVDSYHDAKIASDLDHFDQQYGINGATPTLYDQYGAASTFLTVYAQNGTTNQFLSPASDPSLPADAGSPGANAKATDLEISLDVEWAHALSPGAKIVLIEAHDSSVANLAYAIGYAKQLSGVSVVSMSFGIGEALGTFADSDFSQSGVTFVASTGDSGSYARTAGQYGPASGTVSGTGLGGMVDSYSSPPALATTSADFTIVTYLQSSTTAAQAGISIRNGTGANVENVSLLARPGNPLGGSFQYRTAAGGNTTVNNVSAATVGEFFAIRRSGTGYYGFVSADGATWSQVGFTPVNNMSGTVAVDLVGAGSSPNNFVSFSGTTLYANPTTAAPSPSTSSNVVAVGGTVVG